MFRFRASIVGLIMALGSSAQIPICTIQGSGTASTYDGQTITTTGIVTAVFSGTGTVQGLFIEEPNCDVSSGTSNGIFIYYPNSTGISIGDRVNVSGTVAEYQGATEINSVSSVSVVGSGTVPGTDVTLPVPSSGIWEQYEGMLLHFPQNLVVTNNESWVQYGELVLASERIRHSTQFIDPNDADPNGTSTTGASNAAAVNASTSADALKTILLDDGRTSSYPSPTPYADLNGTLRCGSTFNGLLAVLHYAYGDYRLHPQGATTRVPDARGGPPAPTGDLRVASMNVLNYFSTLNTSGATNAAEQLRQRTKLVAAMEAMDADALVLCEVENNDIAWVQLLDALNAAVGAGTYVGLAHPLGSAFTQSAIFYKPTVLSPVGG
ncbi:MAG TPA: hypothetical protein PK760_03390, partial [Flavobacteriales bacterium]|nr:hypothetical protein [Flavobacteriales bacterium]